VAIPAYFVRGLAEFLEFRMAGIVRLLNKPGLVMHE